MMLIRLLRVRCSLPMTAVIVAASVILLRPFASSSPLPAAVRADALTSPPIPGCASRVQARLFFGLQRPRGLVSDAEWETFLEDEITPRFPDGMTVLHAHGQWRGLDHRVQREASRVVEIVHDESPGAARRIAEIVATYKARFEQESVMVARARVDVCF